MRIIRRCHRDELTYNQQVRISRNLLFLALLAASSALLAGCGGLSAAQTVSPLDFLLPGILKADPPRTNAPALFVKDSVEMATVR